ncbi:transcriptional regulator FeaR [Paraburkholderia tropica]|uniref:transcriptional regulator FeaR n=1 Tax=Paraburkholderia tropica TaxID=92647 RepID=UPI002AB15455|nr:transcriptional regulator FeaR [Paraburkholderia tropica]
MKTHFTHEFDRWSHKVETICGRFSTLPSTDAPVFLGEISHRDLGGLGIAFIRTNAGSICRQRGSETAADDRFCFLVLQQAGTVEVCADNERFLLEPGEMALLDSAEAFQMRPRGLLHQVSIHLDRGELDRVMPVGARRLGKLARNTLSGRLLCDMARQISAEDLSLDDAGTDGDALQGALIALSRAALSEGPESTMLGESLRRQAERLITQTLHDELPSPGKLAASLNISVRQLYRLFEADGEGVSGYVRRQRLLAGARDLIAAAPRSLSITAIALKYGFADSAHFSRLFKQQFGESPKLYRARQQKLAE